MTVSYPSPHEGSSAHLVLLLLACPLGCIQMALGVAGLIALGMTADQACSAVIALTTAGAAGFFALGAHMDVRGER